MKRFMIVMDTVENCYRFMKSRQFHPSECILIFAHNLRENIRGYYNQVMNGEIELFGISKEDFAKIYFSNQKSFEDEYRRTHGFVETELKSSSLANKELKIIKGYLKGKDKHLNLDEADYTEGYLDCAETQKKRIAELEKKIKKIRDYLAYKIPHELMNEATNKIWNMV